MEFVVIWLLLLLAVNAGFSLIVGYIASQKGRSFGGFFVLSFFLSFLVGILAVIAIPRREIITPTSNSYFASTQEGEVAKCPFCSEWVKSEAKVCKHCGRDIDSKLSEIRLQEQEAKIRAEVEYQAQTQAKAEEENRRTQYLKERRDEFLKSKKGKLLLISSAITVVVFLAVGSMFLVGTVVQQQGSARIAADEKTILEQDCSLILDRLANFDQNTSADLNPTSLPSSPGFRETVKEQINRTIPDLILLDAELANSAPEGTYDWQGPAEELGKRILYNLVTLDTNFSPANLGVASVTSADLDLVVVDECLTLLEGQIDDLEIAKERQTLLSIFYKAEALGVAATVIRSCETQGYYIEGIPCE